MSRSRLAIAATALVFVLGACGGSKSSDSAKVAGDSAESSSSDSDSSGDNSSGGLSSVKACAAVKELSPSLGSADSFTEENITDLVSVLGSIKKVADSELKSQVDVALKYFIQFDALMKKYDYDITKVTEDSEAVATLTELSNSEEMTAAGDAIDAWTKDNCGVTLGGQ